MTRSTLICSSVSDSASPMPHSNWGFPPVTRTLASHVFRLSHGFTLNDTVRPFVSAQHTVLQLSCGQYSRVTTRWGDHARVLIQFGEISGAKTDQSLPRSYFSHFLATCSASTMRTVPDLERITMDCVVIRGPL